MQENIQYPTSRRLGYGSAGTECPMMKYKNVKKTQKEFDLQDRFFIRHRRTWMLVIPCSVLDVQNNTLLCSHTMIKKISNVQQRISNDEGRKR